MIIVVVAIIVVVVVVVVGVVVVVVAAGLVVIIIVVGVAVAGHGSVEPGSWGNWRMPHIAELLQRTGWARP